MRRLLIAVTAVATLLAGGCGIPDESDVTVVGPGRSTGPSLGFDRTPPDLPTRDAVTTHYGQFVQNYLQAAAGDTETATARAKAFLAPDTAAAFQPGTDVKVIRLLADPYWTWGKPEVSLKVQLVGTLNANGLLTPEPAPGPAAYKFEVGEVKGRTGLFITKAPPVLLLSDTAVDTYYQPRTIYFWNHDYSRLVPDLRYMPLSVIAEQQPTTILNWLANGPAPWLEDAVRRLPENTKVPGNVPAISNDTLQITLSAQAVPPDDSLALDRLRRMLQWSLRPLEPRTLELKIGHRDPVRYTDQEYRDSNIAARLPDEPERFVIFNGAIRRLDLPNAGRPIPVLRPAANQKIASAAFGSSGTHTFAAVVTGTGAAQRLRVGMAAVGQEADLREVGELRDGLQRPVWAVTPGGDAARAVGLVISNGRLHSFAADGSPARPVAWPGAPGGVTSVSVAPDGQRVALVSGGQLYRAVLTSGGDGIEVSGAAKLLPPELTRVTAVAWGSETYLAVAGVRADGRYSIIDLSVDGALSVVRLKDLGPVTDLTAFPANPIKNAREAGSDVESYVSGGGAWDVLAQPDPISVARLHGPVTGAPPGATPTAPFFLE